MNISSGRIPKYLDIKFIKTAEIIAIKIEIGRTEEEDNFLYFIINPIINAEGINEKIAYTISGNASSVFLENKKRDLTALLTSSVIEIPVINDVIKIDIVVVINKITERISTIPVIFSFFFIKYPKVNAAGIIIIKKYIPEGNNPKVALIRAVETKLTIIPNLKN